MILVYTQKISPRITYIFKQVFVRILGFEIELTSKIENFIAFKGIKFSYGESRMGNEFFVKAHGLLLEQGISEFDIEVQEWGGLPCFFYMGEDSDVPFDVFSASFYLLSRYEEYLPHVRDEYGRFPAEESLAFKNNFLRTPVVDHWAYKLKDALKKEFPEVKFSRRKFKTQNIMVVAELYKYKEKGLVRNIAGGLRDIFGLQIKDTFNRIQTLLAFKKDPFDVYNELLQFSRQNKIVWEFMFQLSDYSIRCNNIGYNNQRYHSMIKSMGDYGKLGLLLGYEALFEEKILQREKKRFENIVNRDLERTISPYFGINLPHLYNMFDVLEITDDYSMGYFNRIGFRAGTCTPFLYYDLNLERISPLRLHPYAFNSMAFEGSSFFEIKTLLDRMKKQVEEVEGNLGMVYNNSDFREGESREKFFQILEKMNENEE